MSSYRANQDIYPSQSLVLVEATVDGTRKQHSDFLVTVSLLIIDGLDMSSLPLSRMLRTPTSRCLAMASQAAMICAPERPAPR